MNGVSPDKNITITEMDGYENFKLDEFTSGIGQKWINVKDRLPEEEVHVLSFCDSDQQKYKLDYMIKINEEIIWARRTLHDDGRAQVTHWMSLPEPPKENDNAAT